MSRLLRDNFNHKLEPKLINKKELNIKISQSQVNNKKYYDKGTKKLEELVIGQTVKYQHRPKTPWLFGKNIEKIRNRLYKIERGEDGKIIIRNRKYIKTTKVDLNPSISCSNSTDNIFDQHFMNKLKQDKPNMTVTQMIIENSDANGTPNVNDIPDVNESEDDEIFEDCSSEDVVDTQNSVRNEFELESGTLADLFQELEPIRTRSGRVVKKPEKYDS